MGGPVLCCWKSVRLERCVEQACALPLAASLLWCSMNYYRAQAGQPTQHEFGLALLQIELRQQAVAAGIPHYLVVDAGRTQIAAGSRTGGVAISCMLSGELPFTSFPHFRPPRLQCWRLGQPARPS